MLKRRKTAVNEKIIFIPLGESDLPPIFGSPALYVNWMKKRGKYD